MKTIFQGEEIDISPPYHPLKLLRIKNGCCPGRPAVLTVNAKADGSPNYSVQCACNLWCTTGCDTPEEAEDYYRGMTARQNRYLRRRSV